MIVLYFCLVFALSDRHSNHAKLLSLRGCNNVKLDNRCVIDMIDSHAISHAFVVYCALSLTLSSFSLSQHRSWQSTTSCLWAQSDCVLQRSFSSPR